MRNTEHGAVVLAGETAQQGMHGEAVTRIEMRGWLVEQKQRCILRQGASEQRALPFSGAQRTDAAAFESGKVGLLHSKR